MDRRTFITHAGSVTMLAGIAGLGIYGCAGPGPLAQLESQLAELADDWFAAHARSHSQRELLTSLTDRGVISLNKGVIHAQLQALAHSDPLIVYRGFYYTPSELDLYALAFLVVAGRQ